MKPKVSMTMDEWETHINHSPAEMGKRLEVYTTIPHIMKQLEKLVNKHPDDCHVVNDDQYSYTVSLPYEYLKLAPPRKLSEKQLEANRIKIEKMHQARMTVQNT